jgi:hypothetical protein
MTTWPHDCPHVELTVNEDRCWQRDLDALKSRRGERMIFEGAGETAGSQQVQAKDRLALTLVSCLVQPHGCNPEAKSCGADQRHKSTRPEGNHKKKIKIFCGDDLSIDFRGHLAVRRSDVEPDKEQEHSRDYQDGQGNQGHIANRCAEAPRPQHPSSVQPRGRQHHAYYHTRHANQGDGAYRPLHRRQNDSFPTGPSHQSYAGNK